MHNGELFQDLEFTLYKWNLDGDVNEFKYVGAWFCADSVYLNWPCTVPNVKDATTYQTIRVSKWIESMNKDV